ncbi:hypothetical protein PMAYCL1PPCAC_26307, partial [Pristionchus mayeri]
AFMLSRADPQISGVLIKMLDCMNTVVKDGVTAPNLAYILDGVNNERERAQKHDEKKNDPLREMVYGMTDALETMIKSMIEKNKEDAKELEELRAFKQEHSECTTTDKVDREINDPEPSAEPVRPPSYSNEPVFRSVKLERLIAHTSSGIYDPADLSGLLKDEEPWENASMEDTNDVEYDMDESVGQNYAD